MALTYKAFAGASVAIDTTYTTPSVSWAVGDLIIVFADNEGVVGSTLTAPTTTGTGITLSQVQRHDTTGSECSAICYGDGHRPVVGQDRHRDCGRKLARPEPVSRGA